MNHCTYFDWMLVHADESLSEELIQHILLLLPQNTLDERFGYAIGEYKLKTRFIGDQKTTSPKQVSKKWWVDGKLSQF